ncbi:MAG: 23S rRNA (uracil(1939)-C(5))-methyltransferase RlmD [Bacillota bacterium]
MLKRNDQIEIEILRYGSNGEGIGVCDGQTVFVPYTIAGEKVKAHIIFVKKNFAIGRATEIITPSKERKQPLCPLFSKCGGCTMQHIGYQNQLEIKKGDVVQTFSKVAGLNLENLSVQGSPNEFGYRNKLSVPFSVDKNGKTICGFYRSGTHDIIEMENCPLQTDAGNTVFQIIKEFVSEYNIAGYKVERGKKSGLLRHAVIRAVKEGVIVVLVVNGGKVPFTDVLYARLQKAVGVVSLYINVNKEDTNVIFGDKFIHKCGPKAIEAEKSGIKFQVGAQSFLQVNDQVVDMLYGEGVEYLDAKENDVVVNCYSGAGFLSGMIAKSAKQVIGIEIVDEATTLADQLAKENGFETAMKNITGDVEVEFPKIVAETQKQGKEVLLVLDPPRKGVDFSTLELIKKQSPKKVVYISCNPQTLSRDVGILVGSLVWQEVDGKKLLKKAENSKPQYKITKNKCFDMFPQTNHVESVVCLELV